MPSLVEKRKKLCLLFLNHNVAWHGSFFRAFHWGRHLVRRGHQVTILTISENNRQRFETQERFGVHLVKTPDLFTGRLRSVMAGNDVGATSRAVCEIMQVDPMSIAHHRLALKEGLFPESLQGITFNCPPRDFVGRRFRLRRSSINYIHLAAFKNVALNKLFYDSPLADALHELLWFIRKNPRIMRFLYGKHGPGEANRGGKVL